MQLHQEVITIDIKIMNPDHTHWVLAYYDLSPITDPHKEVITHKNFIEGRDITCRIYISEGGINGQMSGTVHDAKAYMEWMHGRMEFKNVHFKIHGHFENVFPRKTVKYRKQLVAIDAEYHPSQMGQHVTPKQWKEMLTNMPNRVLLDVRNEYEWKVGRFVGADLPPCDTFREFAAYADELKDKQDPKTTPVMMYCTGGIRCELYSAILKQKGFDQVYQLNGGIIGYGLEQGDDHWLGKLFVFDDRLTVPIAETRHSPVIGACHHCQTPNESYYNCANMECNNLFLCCKSCLTQYQGCCCDDCRSAPRVRAYHENSPHKPFRRQLKDKKAISVATQP